MFRIKNIFVFFVLVMPISFSASANVERYVKKKVDLIVWVNVLDKKTGSTIELYKHQTLQSKWRDSGHEELNNILMEKYGTNEFTHRVIRPGICYVYYTEIDKSGEKKHYLSSGGNLGRQIEISERAKRDGGTVVDLGCVSK